jgi:hypothetical protein
MTDPEQCNYQSFLLRLWREGSQPQWRASLQSTVTGERFGFAGLADLHEFLVQQTTADRHRTQINTLERDNHNELS